MSKTSSSSTNHQTAKPLTPFPRGRLVVLLLLSVPLLYLIGAGYMQRLREDEADDPKADHSAVLFTQRKFELDLCDGKTEGRKTILLSGCVGAPAFASSATTFRIQIDQHPPFIVVSPNGDIRGQIAYCSDALPVTVGIHAFGYTPEVRGEHRSSEFVSITPRTGGVASDEISLIRYPRIGKGRYFCKIGVKVTD